MQLRLIFEQKRFCETNRVNAQNKNLFKSHFFTQKAESTACSGFSSCIIAFFYVKNPEFFKNKKNYEFINRGVFR